MSFAHDIAGGNGNLVATSVQSPNFVSGSAGWQIAKNGSAQFNNLTIRGTFYGSDFILQSAGFFLYSGTPASGNLIASIAPPSTTADSFGNVVVGGGLAAYGTPGTGTRALAALLNSGSSAILELVPPGLTHLTTSPQIFGSSNGAGTATESCWLVLSSGKEGGDDAAIQFVSENFNGTASAKVIFEFGGTVFCTVTKTGLVLPGGATPTAVSGSASIFATTDGAFAVVDGIDQAAYATERRSLVLSANQTINSTGAAIFHQSPVAALTTARTYRINAAYPLTANQAAGAMEIGWGSTPAGSSGLMHIWTTEGTSIWDIGWKAMGTLTSLGFTMSSGTVYSLHIEGVVTIPAGESGTFSLQAACSAAADTFTVDQNGFLDIMPV